MIGFDEKAVEFPPRVFPWNSDFPYNSYKHYIHSRFGGRVQKVSVDAGFTCPNRDGVKALGGCTYCNNTSFVPPYCKPGMSIAEQVGSGVEYLGRRYKANRFLVYFQAYSNTYAPLDYLKGLYQQALAHPQVLGLAIGTRPDCVDEEKIAYFEELAQKYYISIEYGLESINDQTLENLNRGHTFREWAEAVKKTAGRGIHICSHIILGLPGETPEDMLQMAEVISRYPLDSLKIHHLHIVKKTVLAAQYKRNPFPVFGYREYIDLVVEFLQRLRPGILIQRLVGETHPRHLIAPIWGVRANIVQKDIETEMRRRNAWQGKFFKEIA
jgi:hypothetical protein